MVIICWSYGDDMVLLVHHVLHTRFDLNWTREEPCTGFSRVLRVYPTLRSADSTRAAVFARSSAISLFSFPDLPLSLPPVQQLVDFARVSRSLYFKVPLADLCICEAEAASEAASEAAVRVFRNSAARCSCS